MTEREALKLALEALETGLCYVENEDFDNKQKFRGYEHLMPTDAAESIQEIKTAITAIKEALAQPGQEPVAFPRQAGESTWTVDTAFIWRVKHTIDPDTPNDFTPSEEQIETVLLALEKIPSNLYTTPPQRTWVGLTDEERREIGKPYFSSVNASDVAYARAIEAKLKEKNT